MLRYQVCFTCLCEHDGRALSVEKYALECDLLVGCAFGGNNFWGRICVGCKYELYFMPVSGARVIPMLVIMLWYVAVMVIPSVIMIPVPRVSIDPFMIPA